MLLELAINRSLEKWHHFFKWQSLNIVTVTSKKCQGDGRSQSFNSFEGMTKMWDIGLSETLGEKDGVKMVISKSGWAATFAMLSGTENGQYLFDWLRIELVNKGILHELKMIQNCSMVQCYLVELVLFYLKPENLRFDTIFQNPKPIQTWSSANL